MRLTNYEETKAMIDSAEKTLEANPPRALAIAAISIARAILSLADVINRKS
jgi:hypothetical protein